MSAQSDRFANERKDLRHETFGNERNIMRESYTTRKVFPTVTSYKGVKSKEFIYKK